MIDYCLALLKRNYESSMTNMNFNLVQSILIYTFSIQNTADSGYGLEMNDLRET